MCKARDFVLPMVIAAGTTTVSGVEERSPLWVKSFRGDGHTTAGADAIAIDPAGGVIVAGHSGVDNDVDLVVVKYDATGDIEWTASHKGPEGVPDRAAAAALDQEGNVLVAGTSVVASREGEVVLLALSGSGAERWKARFHSPDDRFPVVAGMAVTAAGLAVVVGHHEPPGGDPEAFALAFDRSGELAWEHSVPRAQLNAVKVHPDGAIHATGQQVGTPGPGVSSPWDYLTVRYLEDGTVDWMKRFDDSNHRENRANAIASTATGVVVAGASMTGDFHLDYLVVLYAADGTQGRLFVFDGGGNTDEAKFVAVDPDGDIIVSGNTATQATSFDLTTIKYDPQGRRLWRHRYDGPVSFEDSSRGLAVDPIGNVYVTARSTIDRETRAEEFITFMLGPDGAEIWRGRHIGAGRGRDRPVGIAIDGAGNAYVAGQSAGRSGPEMITLKYGPPSYLRGDCDGDGRIESGLSDAVFLLRFLFLEGDLPPCLAACNFDGGTRSVLTVTDAVYLLHHAFLGGAPPPAPFPSCGPGTARDELLGCARAGCGQAP